MSLTRQGGLQRRDTVNPLAVVARPLAAEKRDATTVTVPYCCRHVEEASGGSEGTEFRHKKRKVLPGRCELNAIASDLRNHFLGHVVNSSIVEQGLTQYIVDHGNDPSNDPNLFLKDLDLF